MITKYWRNVKSKIEAKSWAKIEVTVMQYFLKQGVYDKHEGIPDNINNFVMFMWTTKSKMFVNQY